MKKKILALLLCFSMIAGLSLAVSAGPSILFPQKLDFYGKGNIYTLPNELYWSDGAFSAELSNDTLDIHYNGYVFDEDRRVSVELRFQDLTKEMLQSCLDDSLPLYQSSAEVRSFDGVSLGATATDIEIMVQLSEYGHLTISFSALLKTGRPEDPAYRLKGTLYSYASLEFKDNGIQPGTYILDKSSTAYKNNAVVSTVFGNWTIVNLVNFTATVSEHSLKLSYRANTIDYLATLYKTSTTADGTAFYRANEANGREWSIQVTLDGHLTGTLTAPNGQGAMTLDTNLVLK